MSNTVKILCWTRTDSDHRDVAGGVASAVVPQRVAKKLAVAIDATGNAGAGKYLPCFRLKDGRRLAAGHGVTIQYQSGRIKTYREHE